jgi:hypothetical protein
VSEQQKKHFNKLRCRQTWISAKSGIVEKHLMVLALVGEVRGLRPLISVPIVANEKACKY